MKGKKRMKETNLDFILLDSMTFDVVFDKIITSKHYISPGSYTIESDGKTYKFDFFQSTRENNGKIGHFIVTDYDKEYSYCEETDESACLTYKDFLHGRFKEFFIYTGECDDPKITPIRVENLILKFSDGSIIRKSVSNDVICK